MGFKIYLLLVLAIIGILTHGSIADPPTLCQLPADSGFCKASIPRYAYKPGSGQCEQFLYGGCQGNANNFKTVEECEQTCKN